MTWLHFIKSNKAQAIGVLCRAFSSSCAKFSNAPCRVPVDRFGTLKINSNICVNVKPAISHEEVALFELSGDSEQESAYGINNVKGDVTLTSHIATSSSPDLQWTICVPPTVNIEAELQRKASAHIYMLENRNVSITCDGGKVVLDHVKSEDIRIKSSCGAVTSVGSLHGNIHIVTNSRSGGANVTLGKVVGDEFGCNMGGGGGRLTAGALYTSRLDIGGSGQCDVDISNLHCRCGGRIACGEGGGNIRVTGFTGASCSMETCDGDVSCNVSQLQGDVWLRSDRGDVAVTLPGTAATSLHVSPHGAQPEVDTAFTITTPTPAHGTQEHERHYVISGKANTEAAAPPDTHIHVTVPNGKLRVDMQDWLASLNLSKLKNI